VNAEAVRVVQADLGRPDHRAAVVAMVDMYSRDPMGGSRPLPDAVRADLIPGLKAHPTTLAFLAFAGERAVGIAVCFRGFSTFAAKPLLNIHDLAVHPEFRKRGIGQKLLAAVEDHALAMGCCKLTLEVLEENRTAQKSYRAFGFHGGNSLSDSGRMLFYVKPL
jgi:ribosomal protein S18 acetylase RimI-like enzyme